MLLDYTNMSVFKTATAATVFRYMDCIDSSTCIAVRNANLNEFARFTSSNFLDSLTTYETIPFSQTQSSSYNGLRCFAAVQRCIALGINFAFIFNPLLITDNVGQRIDDALTGDAKFATAGCTPEGLVVVS